MRSSEADGGVRRILHVDMDAFFAAVEVLRHPALAGKPLVIGGRGDPFARGVVSTASYEARRFGVHSAMPLRMAHERCPQAVFLPVDYREYARVSARIKAILRQFSPQLEDVGIDEAYLDVSQLTDPSSRLARAIKQRILTEIGLTCSIGIAPNKLLAKIASDLEKPDGVTVLTEVDVATRIWPLPVRKLQGVGPVTERRLEAIDIHTIGELAATPQARLAALFGPAHGRFLWRSAQGEDDRTVVTHREPKSHSREVTFQADVGDRQTLLRALAGLSERVAEELRAAGRSGSTVGIKLRFADFETRTRVRTLAVPTHAGTAIFAAARACLDRIDLDRKVRLLGVRVGELRIDQTRALETAAHVAEGPMLTLDFGHPDDPAV